MFNSLATFQKFPVQRGPAPGKLRPIRLGSLNLCPLSEGLISEFHYACLVAAVVTSGVNTLYDGPEAAQPFASAGQYAGLDQSLLRTLITVSAETPNGADELISVNAFLAELDESQQVYRLFSSDIPVISEQRAIVVHRHGLITHWQRTCRAALQAITELESVMSGELPEAYVQNHGVLRGLLKSAAQGFKPCLDESGELYMPPLPQKRRWPRFSVLQKCVLQFGTKRTKAFIRDVSAGGMGLDHMPPIAPGTELTVEMDSGRHLVGKIIWTRDSTAGLKFIKPLLATDPLIRG